MAWQEDYRQGGLERYTRPDLIAGLEELDKQRTRRAEIALEAARYIVEVCGGNTTDTRLYYAAMFGRSYEEGLAEKDSNLLVPLGIARDLSRDENRGQAVIVRSPNYPEDNYVAGVLDSLEEDEYTPCRFEVKFEQNEPMTWTGRLAIGMQKVIPVRLPEWDYELAACQVDTCETSVLWMQGKLEIYPRGTGGVTVGEAVHRNAREGQLWWLRNHLAPRTLKPFDQPYEDLRDRERRLRAKFAADQKVSQAKQTAQALSPTVEGFFRQTAGLHREEPIKVLDVFEQWGDAYDAQSLMAELEIRDLIERVDDEQVVLSKLGKAVYGHLQTANA